MTAPTSESPLLSEPDGLRRDVPLSWATTAELVSGGLEHNQIGLHGGSSRLRSFFFINGLYIVLGFVIALLVVQLLPQTWMEEESPGASPDSPAITENPLQPIPTSADIPPHPPADILPDPAIDQLQPNDDTAEPQADGPPKAEKLPTEARHTTGDLNDVDPPPGTAESQPQVQGGFASPSRVEESAPVTTRKKVSPRVRRRVKKLNKKAKIYIKKKRYKSAKRLLQKAIALDPFYAPPYRYLGQTLHRLQDPAGAREAYQNFLKLSPNSRYAPTARKYLKN